MQSPLVRFLLIVNNSYTFFVSSLHMGLMVSVFLFWYPSWEGLTLATIHDNFGIPAKLATNLFVILIPIMFLTCAVTIVSEWKTSLKWPAIVTLLGSFGSTAMAYYFLFPINNQIAAGLPTQADLAATLQRWMRLNDIRVCFSVSTWLAVLVFIQMKINQPKQ
jgi:hypothetical protein